MSESLLPPYIPSKLDTTVDLHRAGGLNVLTSSPFDKLQLVKTIPYIAKDPGNYSF